MCYFLRRSNVCVQTCMCACMRTYMHVHLMLLFINLIIDRIGLPNVNCVLQNTNRTCSAVCNRVHPCVTVIICPHRSCVWSIVTQPW